VTEDEPEVPPPGYPPVPSEPASPKQNPLGTDGGPANPLAKLILLRPFVDLNGRMKDSRGWKGTLCFLTEYVLTLIVYLVIVAVLVVIAEKTLSPLPSWLSWLK